MDPDLATRFLYRAGFVLRLALLLPLLAGLLILSVRGGWWIAASWVLVILTMLFAPPRLANRWAWFWLFTVGQVGAILYLVLEPRPLWQGPGEGLTRDKRVNGGSGCAYSIILAIVSGLAALGIGRLVELVLG
ncbi:MAG TPA: hypothetical protein VM347_22760 [Nonomuraea sp.]|nr:hypothetical protein [Nonomuraea sp.]